jgi:hypothetical protein
MYAMKGKCRGNAETLFVIGLRRIILQGIGFY